MGVLLPIVFLGVVINVAVFLIAWYFRGRGFSELAFWRRSTPTPDGRNGRTRD